MLNTARATRGMVTAPHHLASEAGLRVLREGGNAIEAAVAVAAALTVVYPHMNALGGDNFWLIHGPGGKVTAIDPPEGKGLNAWPMVRFEGSELRVFVGRAEKRKKELDLEPLRQQLVGETIAFRSEVFPNGGGLGALLTLDKKKGEPVLQAGAEDPATKEFQDPASLGVKISYAWMYPITCLLTLGCGILGGLIIGKKKPEGA